MDDETLEKADRPLRQFLEDAPDDTPIQAVLVFTPDDDPKSEPAEQLSRSDFETRAKWREYLYQQTQQQTPDVKQALREYGVELRGEPLGEMLLVRGPAKGVRNVLDMHQVKAALLDRKIDL